MCPRTICQFLFSFAHHDADIHLLQPLLYSGHVLRRYRTLHATWYADSRHHNLYLSEWVLNRDRQFIPRIHTCMASFAVPHMLPATCVCIICIQKIIAVPCSACMTCFVHQINYCTSMKWWVLPPSTSRAAQINTRTYCCYTYVILPIWLIGKVHTTYGDPNDIPFKHVVIGTQKGTQSPQNVDKSAPCVIFDVTKGFYRVERQSFAHFRTFYSMTLVLLQ